jgi:ribosomal-protein-alanine N-acetyltransferase
MANGDLLPVLEIEGASYSMPWSEETFRGLLRRMDAEALVAERDETIVAYVIYWWVAEQAELGNVAVSESYRGQGIGELLVREVLARAARRDVAEVFLEVRPSNPSARRLYERLGFREVGRRRNYYVRPTEDALVMRRALED